MDERIKLNVTITQFELGQLVMQQAAQMAGVEDDAGCDWLTDGNDTYIGGDDWHVSALANVARLVDAANILMYGRRSVLPKERPDSYYRANYDTPLGDSYGG